MTSVPEHEPVSNLSVGENEDLFGLLMSAIHDCAIVMLDARGMVVSWNDRASEIKGHIAAEIMQQHFSNFYLPSDRDKDKPSHDLTAARQTGRFEDEGWRVRSDGSRFFANVVLAPRFSRSGELIGFAEITHDISKRRESELALKEYKQRLSLALNAGQVGIWDWDMLSETVWRSAKHDEIFGYEESPASWSLASFSTHVYNADRKMMKESFRHGIKSGSLNFECRIVRTDGALRWVAIQGKVIKDEMRRAVRMLGTVVDITDRKLESDRQCILAVISEREDFIATLTHDLKNPLIGANRVLELMVEGRVGELTREQCNLLDGLRRSNKEALKLMKDLGDVYKLEKDVNSLALEETEIVGLVSAVAELFEPLALAHEIAIEKSLPVAMQLCQLDKKAIERVIQNLMDNALKFTPKGGVVALRLFEQNAHAVIEVENSGPGISDEDKERLFKRYAQGATGKRYANGSGLGLYLCKQIAEAHGGAIEFESSPDVATIFRVKFPFEKIGQMVSAG